jgi:endo-alpha-1,4-polygalactosaminidase (GH114 family)
MSGNRIAVLQNDGTLLVKEGMDISAAKWVTEEGAVSDYQIASPEVRRREALSDISKRQWCVYVVEYAQQAPGGSVTLNVVKRETVTSDAKPVTEAIRIASGALYTIEEGPCK